jgi:hypothetical protein
MAYADQDGHRCGGVRSPRRSLSHALAVWLPLQAFCLETEVNFPEWGQVLFLNWEARVYEEFRYGLQVV